jgi:hypothetical protein
MKPQGIYRERNGWANQHSVRVKYDEGNELDVPEDRYKSDGYQPPFDQLPWKDAGGLSMQNYAFLLEEYASRVAADLVQCRADLEPLESGWMHLGERVGDGPWVDTTQRKIDQKKRTIAIYEEILKKIRAQLAAP